MAVYDDNRNKSDNNPLVPTAAEDDERRRIDAASVGGESDNAATDAGNKKRRFDPRARAMERKTDKFGGKSRDVPAETATGAANASVGGMAAGFGSGLLGTAKLIGMQLFGSRRRQAATGGGALGIAAIVAAIMGLSAVQGPLQWVHLAETFSKHFSAQDDFTEKISARFVIYALAGKTAQGRLGYTQNKIASRMEAKLNNESGLRSIYQQGTQRLIGYEVIDSDKAAKFTADLERDGIPTNVSVSGVDIDGNPRTVVGVNFQDNRFRTKRSITRVAVNSLQLNKVTAAIAKRLLIKRGGVDFHPIKNVFRNQADNYAKWREEQKKKRAEKIENGVRGSSPERAKAKEEKEKLKNMSTKVKAAAAAAVVVACIIRDASNGVDTINQANQQTMIRMGMAGVTTGEQVKYGKDAGKPINAELLGVYSEELYDPATKSSWTSDQGVQELMGEGAVGKDYGEDIKPRPKPGALGLADGLLNAQPLAGVCDAFNWVNDVIDSIPGVGDALGAVSGVLSEAGLNPGDYVQKFVEFAANGTVDATSSGGLRGAEMNIGMRLAANDSARAMGGRELSESEETQLVFRSRQEETEKLANASFYDKYLNLNTSTSLASSTILTMPHDMNQLVAAVFNLPNQLSQMAASVLGGRQVSAAPKYDYGFKAAGFSLAEQANTDYENPYANPMESNPQLLDRMNQEYGQKCFNMQIPSNPSSPIVYGESGDFNKIPAECNDPNNKDLVDYRFYMATTITKMSEACYYGDEDSCNQISGGGGSTETAAPTTPGTAPAGNPQQLAGLLANSVNIIWTNPETKTQLERYSRGEKVTNACGEPMGVSPYLSSTLIELTRSKYRVTVDDIGFIQDRSYCERGTFQHPKGNAVDIQALEIIGGAKTSPGLDTYDANDRTITSQFATDFVALLPPSSRGGVGQKQCGVSPTWPSWATNVNGAALFEDSCDHLHIDVRNRDNLNEALGTPN